jgi:hypothetical protein
MNLDASPGVGRDEVIVIVDIPIRARESTWCFALHLFDPCVRAADSVSLDRSSIESPDLPHVRDFRIESDYSKLSACYPIPQISGPRDSSKLSHPSLQDFLGRWSVGPMDEFRDEKSKAEADLKGMMPHRATTIYGTSHLSISYCR